MKYFFILLSLFIYFNLNAQETFNPDNQTWTINPETVVCDKSTNKECLLVKYFGRKEFKVFNDKIEGFQFEKGYTYTIIVKQEIKKPPINIDESVFKYVLVKIISKKDVTNKNILTPETSQNISSIITTIDIDYETVNCEYGTDKQCFLIKAKDQKEFEIFNGCVYGFTYEAGNRYNLTVKKNGSDYDFIKVNKKELVSYNTSKITCVNPRSSAPLASATTTAPALNPNTYNSPLDNKKWYLKTMRENETSLFELDENVFYIEFNSFKDRLNGSGSCNTFEGIFKTDTKTSFNVDAINVGYKHCGTEKIENLFIDQLKKCDRFEIKDGILQLSKQWQIQLWFGPANISKTVLSTQVAVAVTDPINSPSTLSTPISSQIKESSINETNLKVAPEQTTIKNDVNTTITSSVVLDPKDKEIAELKKQLAEQKTIIIEKNDSLIKNQTNTKPISSVINNTTEKPIVLSEQEKLEQEAIDLKKQLAAKKTKEEVDKAAALKVQQDAEVKKQAEVEKAKKEKLKEIESLKKQLAEKEADIGVISTQNVLSNKPNEDEKKDNKINKPITKEEAYITKEEFKAPTEKEIAQAEDSKIKIGLMNFTGPSDLRSYALILQDKVSVCFTSKNRFTIVDRTKFDQISKERELQKSEEFLDGYIVEQGKSTGAKFIVSGQLSDISSTSTLYTKKNSNGQITGYVTKYQAQISFSLSILDVETGASKSAKSFTISTSTSNAGLSFLSGMLGGTPGYNSQDAAIAEVYNRVQGYVLGWINAVFPVEMKILRIDTKDKNGFPASVTVKGGSDTDLKKKSDLNVIIYEKIESDGQQFIKPKIIGQLVVQEVTGEFSTCKVKNGEVQIDENLKKGTLMKLEIKSYK